VIEPSSVDGTYTYSFAPATFGESLPAAVSLYRFVGLINAGIPAITGTPGNVVVGASVVGAAVVASGMVVEAAFAVDPGVAVVAFPVVETASPAELGGVARAIGAALAAQDAASIEIPTISMETRRGKGV
jgi:hypothetical protein